MKVVVMLSKDIFAAGKKTAEYSGFSEKVRSKDKIHTVRSNPQYWQKKIATLKEKGGILCLRQWSDKPYRSPQETILEVPAELVEVQTLVLNREKVEKYRANINGKDIEIDQIAKNDGLSSINFINWFSPMFDKAGTNELTFAIIHFTKFRY